MRKPDFFIVGGPKCGTTSMYTYLKSHPEIFLPRRKEPHFFCKDLYSPRYVKSETQYLSLFQAARHEKRVGEASVYYLYSTVAAREIKKFSPSASIIVMLRNPVDMIYSLHSQRLYSGHEDIADFETALAAETYRRQGLALPEDPFPIECLFYREVGKFAQQLKRYLACFGPERVHSVVFDDIVRDPARVYSKVCEFLGVRQDNRLEFGAANANKRVRSKTLRAMLKFSPATRRLARTFLPRSARHSLAKGLVRLNTKHETRRPLRSELRRRLQIEFLSEVEVLSGLLQRDLTPWCHDSQIIGEDSVPAERQATLRGS